MTTPSPDSQRLPSPLLAWLEARDCHIPAKWLKIGTEVYARKTLLLASAQELENRGLRNAKRLAATDVFV